MIAVDTSALMAILLDEAAADACIAAIEAEDILMLSAGTMAEALSVAAGRGLGHEMELLIDGLGFEMTAVTPATARRVAQIYTKWGKGKHTLALNFGDCFAYDMAKENRCALLYVRENDSDGEVVWMV